jgi:nucleotide-binding universal stress UspA family protein
MKTKNDNKVLACVDRSAYAEAVTDCAAWAARQMNAPLELLHAIDRHPAQGQGTDHSGAIGVNAQEQLLTQLSVEDEARVRSAKAAGRVFLGRLRQQALAAGATEVDVRLRHGSLAETLAEQEAGVRLIVMGRRGESAHATQPDLGRQVEHTVRHLHKPVLLTMDGFKPPERVMFAFDGGAVTRRGVQTLAASPLLRGIPIHVLMSGPPRQDTPRHLAWASQQLTDAGFEVSSAQLPGDAQQVIVRAIEERQVDLLVMGAYSHSALRSLLFGSRTNGLLRASRVPTLLLR